LVECSQAFNEISSKDYSQQGQKVAIRRIFKQISNENHINKWRVVFWLNGALLLYLTLMPSVSYRVSYQHIDKVFHFIGFGAFAFFCLFAFPKLKPTLVIVLSLALGVLVEVIQSFIPHRGFSYLDMLADLAGILFAVLFMLGIKKFLK
jgi:VanZ family protein